MPALRLVLGLYLIGTPSLLFSSAMTFDPSCPVFGDAATRTNELLVRYDPGSSGALKGAQKLTLEVAVNSAKFAPKAISAPMTHTASGWWEAKLHQGEKDFWLYMMAQVKDTTTGAIDNNEGRFWDVVFCWGSGKGVHSQSVQAQADSYLGHRYPNGMNREQDYEKALAMLDQFMRGNELTRYNVLTDFWEYQITRDGRSETGWRSIAIKIRDFIETHKKDRYALIAAVNFVALNQKDLPPELPNQLLRLVRSLDPQEAENCEALTEQARIYRLTDQREKADAISRFVKRYPSREEVLDLLAERFRLLYELHDFAAAEQLVRERMQASPSADAYFALAAVYVWSNQHLDEAMKLLDQAEEADKKAAHAPSESGHLLLSPDASGRAARFADVRRKAYMLQGKPDMALPQALKAVEAESSFSRVVALGNVYEATGDKPNAVKAYLEAATMPSGHQHKAMEPLEKLWVAEKLGTIEQLHAKVAAKLHADQEGYFVEAKYVPNILDYAVTPFDFTTRTGERVLSSALGDKILVLNVWAIWCGPCLPELPGFLELQKKHPELRVVTLTQKADSEKLSQYLRDEHLESLPLAEDNHAFEQLASSGVPVTYVIKNGRVRVYHQDYLSNVVAYIEADLTALNAASQ